MLLLFLKKHISLIVFFVILHPKIITPKNENKNDVKTELNYRMANVKLGAFIKIMMSEKE